MSSLISPHLSGRWPRALPLDLWGLAQKAGASVERRTMHVSQVIFSRSSERSAGVCEARGSGFGPRQMENQQNPSFESARLFGHRTFFASDNSEHIRLLPPLAREKIVKRVVGCRRRLLIFGCSDGHNVMDSQLLEINLFGACSVRATAAEGFELTGAKHKALLVLLATAPFGRRTRAFLQETLWGVACYDTGRQSLRRALADIKSIMGASFGELVTSTNSDVTLDLSRVTFVGRPGQGAFLEGLDIRESGFGQWLASIRQNPRQLDGLFSLASCTGGASVLPTIAVLPFRAIADDIADATISDWLAEEICRSLSRSRLLSVISHLWRCHVNCWQAPRGAFSLVTGSGGDAGHGFPVRHGVQTMQMGGQGGAMGSGRDEQVADGGEDRDEPL